MCGKQFKSQKTLTQHNRDVHSEEDIPCTSCDKTFRTKKHLAYHKSSKHTEKESDETECSYQYHSTSCVMFSCAPFKQLQIKKQNNIDCIYMTSLCCESILSLFWCVEPLKKIRGCGWVFLLIGLALLRTTLCACSRSFWGGAENRSSIGLLIWPAHLFRHFLRRVRHTSYLSFFYTDKNFGQKILHQRTR